MRKHYVVQLDRTRSKSRCREWQLRVDSLRKTKGGSTSWLTRKVSGKTYTQAARMCEEWAADLDEGRAVATTRKWTFREYREHWEACMRAEGAPEKSLEVRASQLSVVGRHLDGYRLDQITPHALNEAYAALRAGESPSGRTLSGTYVNNIAGTVSSMLSFAVGEGELASNPARRATPPRRDTPERGEPSMEAVAAMERAMDPADWRGRCAILLAETGMRQVEAVALDWGSWDEVAGTIAVGRSKTPAGLRLVPVTRTLRECLAVAKLHYQLAFGEEDVSGYPLLCDEFGRRPSVKSFYDWWEHRRDSFGMGGFSPHQLRHAMASQLLRNGATLKEVQDILGDKSGAMVLRVYAHSGIEERARTMQGLDDARRGVQDMYKDARP